MNIQGELARRLQLNRKRLSDPTYAYPLIFKQGGEWPGDWQGRAILALVNHYEVTTNLKHKKQLKKQLDDIIYALDEHVNEDGYFGKKLNLDSINEQQISGNSWFIRGLCEYHQQFHDDRSLKLIKKIIETYLLKLSNAYHTYPNIKREDGGVGGHLLKKTYNHWQLSSDVGCAYIMLDGASHAYQITKDERLSLVLDIMVENFLKLNLVENNCQTHATLSATRGMMRYYQIKKDPVLLQHVIDVYNIYLKEGMTINYANYNWFGKPLWTEPCAVVDSFILASKLYQETQSFEYLRLMNRIYYNALLIGQRKNGGAGCETCLVHQDSTLKIHMYEAYFCCSMRLAEGLKTAAKSLVFEKDDHITIALMNDFDHYENTNHDVTIQLEVIHKDSTKLTVTIDNKQHKEGMVHIYIPLGVHVMDASSDYSYKDMISFPLTTEQFVVTYIVDTRIEIIKDASVQIKGDHILLKKEHKTIHEPMTDYTKLNKNKALKDIQKL